MIVEVTVAATVSNRFGVGEAVAILASLGVQKESIRVTDKRYAGYIVLKAFVPPSCFPALWRNPHVLCVKAR